MIHVFMGKKLTKIYYADFYTEYLERRMTGRKLSIDPEYYLRNYNRLDEWVQVDVNENINFPLMKGDIFLLNGGQFDIEKTVVNPDGSITCYLSHIESITEDLESRNQALENIKKEMVEHKIIDDAGNEVVQVFEDKKREFWKRFFGL